MPLPSALKGTRAAQQGAPPRPPSLSAPLPPTPASPPAATGVGREGTEEKKGGEGEGKMETCKHGKLGNRMPFGSSQGWLVCVGKVWLIMTSCRQSRSRHFDAYVYSCCPKAAADAILKNLMAFARTAWRGKKLIAVDALCPAPSMGRLVFLVFELVWSSKSM